MTLRRYLRPTNARLRLAVGGVLAALFCIQCTRSDALRGGSLAQAVTPGSAAGVSPRRLAELERLARTDHIALLRLAREYYRKNYRDYTCTFVKQERINGQLRPEQHIAVKFLEQPFSVAMRWTRNAPIGDRVLYVQGRYNGQMLVRPKAKFLRALVGGAARRNPEGKDVMANTLRPVTMFGFARLMDSLLEVYELAASRGELVGRFLGYREMDGRRVMVLERVLPAREDYPAKRTVWYLDVERLVPLGLEGYDWDDRLVCAYAYKDVKFNVGLTEDDFTPQANGMRVRK